MEELLAETVNLAVACKLIPAAALATVVVDSTVQEKAVAHPTDARLLETARTMLVDAAKQAGIEFKQTFAREGQHLSFKAGRFAHARQFKRMRAVIQRQRTVVGRLVREVGRLATVAGGAAQTRLNEVLGKARAAPAFVGNSLRCVSCHLDAGRLADSSPMWAAFVSYPAYRSKNKSVNSFQQRLQGCFEYSMNGKAPPLGAPELVALESYAYWLASGAPINPNLAGRGYPALARPALAADFTRGEQVYTQNCLLCHGADGAGQKAPDGTAVFPALWGPDSFNWGAGMGRINNAAAFVKANMPLGLPSTLTDQQAWDVALYMNSHERPQDPRYTGNVQATRKAFHATEESMYGREVAGRVLGASGPPKPFKPFQSSQKN